MAYSHQDFFRILDFPWAVFQKENGGDKEPWVLLDRHSSWPDDWVHPSADPAAISLSEYLEEALQSQTSVFADMSGDSNHSLQRLVILPLAGDTVGLWAVDVSDLRYKYAMVADYAWGWEGWEDSSGQWLYVSPDCQRISGFTVQEFIDDPGLFSERLLDQDRTRWCKARDRAARDAEHYKIDLRLRRADGSLVWLRQHGRAVLSPTGSFGGYRVFNEDITEQKQTEQQLQESEAQYRTLAETASELIWVYDYDQAHFSFLSPATLGLWGQEPAEARQLNWEQITCEEHLEELRQRLTRTAELFRRDGGVQEFVVEQQQRHREGRAIWVAMSAKCRWGSSGQLEFVGVTRNIEARKRMEQALEAALFRDPLTDLYNRRFFEEELERMDSAFYWPISLIVGDINGLKLVNDAFGTDAGDALLTDIANILQQSARPQDITARTSGDEYHVILPRTDTAEAELLMQRLEQAVDGHAEATASSYGFYSMTFAFVTKDGSTPSLRTMRTAALNRLNRRKMLEHASSQSAILSSLKAAMYARSEETEAHCMRLAKHATALGKLLRLSVEQLNDLRLLCQLHDIGKIGIDDSILKKAGPLTADEWVKMKEHPVIGSRIATALPELQSIMESIRDHHERWDGKGYPNGLRSRQIPILARILSVVDAFDAMTQDRIYRKAMPEPEAVRELLDHAGDQFDPEVVALFIEKVLKAEQTDERQRKAGLE